MRVLSGSVFGGIVMASVILEAPIWGIDRNWEAHRSCRRCIQGNGALCRKLAEVTFRRALPALRYEWPACNKDDMAEAVLWAAVHDRGLLDRYMAQFRRICRYS